MRTSSGAATARTSPDAAQVGPGGSCVCPLDLCEEEHPTPASSHTIIHKPFMPSSFVPGHFNPRQYSPACGFLQLPHAGGRGILLRE